MMRDFVEDEEKSTGKKILRIDQKIAVVMHCVGNRSKTYVIDDLQDNI